MFGYDDKKRSPLRPTRGKLVLLLLAPIPVLFLFQVMMRQIAPSAPLLVGELDVRLGDQEPYHLVIQLDPVGGQAQLEGGLRLEGEARLRRAVFPWPEAPFHARLVIELPGEPLSIKQTPFALSSEDDAFVAWYQERYVRGGASFSTQVPCEGRVDVGHVATKVRGSVVEWSQVFAFDGTLALDCLSPGRDLAFGTADDLEWSIEGPLGLRWRSPTG